MENKFWIKNVEWRYENYEHLGVRVCHIPTDIQCFVNNKNSNTHALFLALKSLEEKVNEHYLREEQEINKEFQKTLYKDYPRGREGYLKDNQLQQKIEPEVQREIRTKALELACSLYNTAYFCDKKEPIGEVAKRFYTYITKGESS